MAPELARLDVLIDVLVEAMVREIEANKNGDVSGQDQRRRKDQTDATLSLPPPETHA